MGLALDSPIEQDVLQHIVKDAELRDAKLIVLDDEN
jgi:hypothetical protein